MVCRRRRGGGAWRDAAAAFAGPAKFEIFNEPFGYNSTAAYLSEMLTIVDGAGLPHDRVVLDGLGYAEEERRRQRSGRVA